MSLLGRSICQLTTIYRCVRWSEESRGHEFTDGLLLLSIQTTFCFRYHSNILVKEVVRFYPARRRSVNSTYENWA